MDLLHPMWPQKLADRVARWCSRHVLLVVAGAAAVFVFLLWHGPDWFDSVGLRGLTAVQRQTAVDADRGRIVQLGAGLLAGGALLYTALNFRLSREGHVTDRYTKAIEQFGSERLDVRLGAIYALERIMLDSKRDHPTIVEVLAAFVREHSPTGAPSNADQAERPNPPVDPLRLPAADVQAALTVLGRRPPGRRERGSLNFEAANLAYADLRGANLAGANLIGADLAHARLDDANLVGATLLGVRLTGASLYQAVWDSTTLAGIDLTDVRGVP